MGEVNPNAARGLDKILQACAQAIAPYLAPYLEDHYKGNSDDIDIGELASEVRYELDMSEVASEVQSALDYYDLYNELESYVQDEIKDFFKHESFTVTGSIKHTPEG